MVAKPTYGSPNGNSAELQRVTDAAKVGSESLARATALQRGAYDTFGSMAAGPSAAAVAQQKAAAARAQAGSMALAGQTRGGNIAAAEQAAMQASVAGQQAAAADANVLQAQQEMAARQAQAAVAGQMASQGLEQQLGLEGIVGSAQLGQMNAQVESQLGNRQLDMQAKQQRFDNIMKGIQTGANVVGSIGGAVMSDERSKERIAPSGMAATAAVAEADPITFDYRPGYGPHGRRVGITADSLERTPVGAQVVRRDPATGMKVVDTDQLSTINTAALAELAPRIEALEREAGGGGRAEPSPEQRGRDLAAAISDARAARYARQNPGSMSLAGEAADAGLRRSGGGRDPGGAEVRQGLRARVDALRQRAGSRDLAAMFASMGGA